ncbi:Nitroreductase family [Phytophthora cinnamomi]|uniref:Nitroreductase family n=1 Tax=Phytophthora cinnamomi TaxID=4785 RepID=UPI00355A52CD|nr:Nitroreductase family [Phytophthora cinnamomi]
MAKQLGAAIRERFACKSFLSDPVPAETLREILKLTERAPTGFNTQAYVCIVVRSAEDRARLAGAMMDSNIRKINEAPSPSSSRPIAPSKNVPRLQQLGRDNGAPEALVNKVPHAVELFSGERNPIVSTVAWAYKQTTFAAATFFIPVVVALGYANPDAKPAKPSVRFPSSEVFFDGEFGQSLAKFFEEE